jgi:magnesium-transporting ATPase (P-type)
MTRIIEIKKDKPEIKSTENNDNLSDYQFYSNLSNEEILKTLSSNLDGLTDENAKKLLSTNGKNIALKETIHGPIYFLFNAFKDHFIIILLFLAVINYSLGDHLGSYIIILIALISALIRFFQDYSVYKFNQKLKAKI